MIEFLETYGPNIVPAIAIISALFPFIRSRVISDKNILKTFGNIKEMAKTINFKELDINKALGKIELLTSNLSNEIKNIKSDIGDEIKRIDQTILEFTQDELYTKMLLGLSQLDELNKVLQNKDTTIQDIKFQLKEIHKKLG